MNKSFMSVLCLVAGLVAAGSAAADVRVRGGAGTGTYEITAKDADGVQFGGYTADYTATSVGLTYLVPQAGIYVDVYTAQFSGDTDFRPVTTDFSHNESTLTLGYSANNFTVYGGYKDASTEAKYPGNIPPDIFEVSGFVFGAGYSPTFGNSSLTLSIGTGYLDGTYTPFPNQSYTASTFGFSGGVAYKYSFHGGLSLGVDWKYSGYEFEFTDATLLEEFNQFGMTLAYTF